MTPLRRLLDLIYALGLSVILLPVIVGVVLLILLRDGRPIFYLSERMKTPETGFLLVKFRTMTVVETDAGVSGGDKTARITKTGGWLRDKRLDELPQLWNVLRGDLSFVGPRPPLRRYVEKFPYLYQNVLNDRPGITGLATICFHRHEERLLALCKTASETEEIYCRRCVPRKARLDLIYAQSRSACSDLRVMVATVFRKISLHNR